MGKENDMELKLNEGIRKFAKFSADTFYQLNLVGQSYPIPYTEIRNLYGKF